MNRLSSLLRLSTLSGLALVAPLFAQCPADPTTVLAGKWTFQLPGIAVGNLTAVQGSYRFTTTMSIVAGQHVYSTANGSGSYTLNDTCTGGAIFFNNTFGNPPGGIQANFFIANNATYGRVITLRSTVRAVNPNSFPVPPVDLTNIALYTQVGTMWPAVTACPVGVTPLNSLNGTYNTVTLSGVTGGTLLGRLVIGSANLGFQPSSLDPRGLATMFLRPNPATPPLNPPTPATPIPVVSRDGDPAQYGVAADCGSGSMLIYFAWPRPYCIYFYGRQRLDGTIDYVGLGHAVIPPFAATDVVIAR